MKGGSRNVDRALKASVLRLRRAERRLGKQLPHLMRSTGVQSRRKLAEHIEQAEACLKQLERSLKHREAKAR